MKNSGEEGFVLAATLWFVALLALVAVVVEGWISPVLDRANTLHQRVRSQSAEISVTDRVVFLAITGQFSARGIELVPNTASQKTPQSNPAPQKLPPETPHIALDGRPYRIGDVVARLQDEGGLYDLSDISREPLQKLLSSYGLATADIAAMTAGLVDYQKKSTDTSRDTDYARAGLPLPRHSRLLTPWEPYRIFGWPRTDALWRGPSAVAEMVTTGPVGGLNVNTAPAKVLTAIAGIDEREATRLVAARSDRPITNIRDVTGAQATPTRPLELILSNIIRLKLTTTADPLTQIVSFRLTPTGTAPYRIDFAVDLPQGAAAPVQAAAPIPPLPIATGDQ